MWRVEERGGNMKGWDEKRVGRRRFQRAEKVKRKSREIWVNPRFFVDKHKQQAIKFFLQSCRCFSCTGDDNHTVRYIHPARNWDYSTLFFFLKFIPSTGVRFSPYGHRITLCQDVIKSVISVLMSIGGQPRQKKCWRRARYELNWTLEFSPAVITNDDFVWVPP